MTNSKKPSLKSHRTRTAAVTFSVAALVGIGVWMMPATADDAPGPVTVDAVPSEHRPGDDPGQEEFVDDIKDLRGLEGEERRDAMRQLRDDARDGKYGEHVGQRFERRADHRAAFFALLPDELQSDLEALKDAEPQERKAMREEIREKALDGGYGDKVQEAWKLLDEHRRGKSD